MSDQHHIALPTGYRLENYRLDSVLGHGGFGITYRAVDEDLRDTVAIKEYLPREVAFRDHDTTVNPLSESDREIFEWGLERFLDEARTLARFRHPNIVGVRRFIRANGTAYLVMDYCEGESLESVLARDGMLSPERFEAMLVPLLDALEVLHAAGVTHRDIKPGNIYLREDGSPVLLDFGAARQALAQHSRSVTAMATPGYAAFEQYSTKGKQGPWTDIYGLGATLYRCVTGQRPPDASDRMLEDELVPATQAASGSYQGPLLAQIDAALRIRPEERPQGIKEWRRHAEVESASRAAHRGAPAADGWNEWQDDQDLRGSRNRHLSPAAHGMDAMNVAKASPTRSVEGVPKLVEPKTKGSGNAPWLFVIGVLVAAIVLWTLIDTWTEEGRYQILGTQGEIVRDNVTGLEWQRCSLGQTWNGRTCVGEARQYKWDEAHQAADRLAGWRLPTIDELRTLTYCSNRKPARFSNGRLCEGDYRRPTTMHEAFPNTPSSDFWSGSPVANYSNLAWYVGFGHGGANNNFRSGVGRVRLVRGGQ